MPIKSFLKENYILVTGAVLPVILALVFFLAMVLPGQMAPPPQHDFLFTVDEYRPGGQQAVGVRYDVYKNALRATLLVGGQPNSYQSVPRLFVYEVARSTAREISVDLPVTPEQVPSDRQLHIEEVADLYLDSRLTSPDGYEFHHSLYSGGGGLFTELFVSGRSRNEPALVMKGGATVRLNLPTGRYNYYNARFLGWVLPRP